MICNLRYTRSPVAKQVLIPATEVVSINCPKKLRIDLATWSCNVSGGEWVIEKGVEFESTTGDIINWYPINHTISDTVCVDFGCTFVARAMCQQVLEGSLTDMGICSYSDMTGVDAIPNWSPGNC